MGRLGKIKRELIKESNIKLLSPIDFTISVKNCLIMIYRSKTLYTYQLQADATVLWKDVCVNSIEIKKNGNEYEGTMTYKHPISKETNEGELKDLVIKKILKNLGNETIEFYSEENKKKLRLLKIE